MKKRLVAVMDIGTTPNLFSAAKKKNPRRLLPRGPAFEGGKISCGMPVCPAH